MSEEQTNGESGLKSRIAKYARWFLISVTMIAIIYTVIMATIKKFG
jgi:predicted anti-sigma-YlaC factor YlaD